MKRAGLQARLVRIELRAVRRPPPRVIFGVHNRCAEDVIGYSGRKESVLRLPGESIEALQARAWASTGAVWLGSLYEAPSEPNGEVIKPIQLPVFDDAPALAGIGRVATRQELERMGVIPVPPERLI